MLDIQALTADRLLRTLIFVVQKINLGGALACHGLTLHRTFEDLTRSSKTQLRPKYMYLSRIL